MSSIKPIAFMALCYVNFFRSVPLLLVIFWFYFMVPLLVGRSTGPFVPALVAFILFETAYYCEIVRNGVQSIPRGQVNAGFVHGLVAPGDDALHRNAAGVPEHAAHFDDAMHHPVSGYVTCLRGNTARFHDVQPVQLLIKSSASWRCMRSQPWFISLSVLRRLASLHSVGLEDLSVDRDS